MCYEIGKHEFCCHFLNCLELQLLWTIAGYFVNLDRVGIIDQKYGKQNGSIVFCSLKVSAECAIRWLI